MTDNHVGMEEDREIIYITDEEGNDEEFEVLMTFDVDGSDAKYMMVVPVEVGDDEDESEVYAFRYEEDGDDIKLFMIQDEAEWAIVEETFNTLVDSEDDEETV
ncbi:DUF1292 domain-containing protein [Paenibacillus sp. Marseille-Q4541]|uniref:DUF1292 domain-containing protein n=1 Tax=Paenibacillus sp. Marseille-Q4541 TaxID=2831522 RepID=UPI001BAC0ECE|nr:DUF1292 domain-containing protein [Paenibacillus sp. Marseille-Q4541]